MTDDQKSEEVDSDDDRLSPVEAAKFLKIHVVTLRRWQKDKKGFPQPFILSTRKWFFSKAALDTWFKNQRGG